MTILVVLSIASVATVCVQAIRLAQLQTRLTKTRTELDETSEELAACQKLNKQLTDKPKLSLKQADIQADISHPVPTVSTEQRIRERKSIQQVLEDVRKNPEEPRTILPGEVRIGYPSPPNLNFKAAAQIDPYDLTWMQTSRDTTPDSPTENHQIRIHEPTHGPAAWAPTATPEPIPSCHTEQSWGGSQSFCSDTASYSDSSPPTCGND